MIKHSLLLLLLFHSSGRAQDSLALMGRLETDAARVWQDAGRFATAPLHFSHSDIVTAGILLGGTALLLTVDHSGRDLALRNRSSTGDDLDNIGSKYGEAKYGLALSAVLYGTGLAARAPEMRETAIDLVESIAFAGITTTVLKSLVGRARPYTDEGTTTFRPFQLNNDYLSFPSGHSTVAFAVSSVLAERIGNPFATVGLYSLAALTATSRVYSDEHWLSDVTAGAIIGTVSGLAVCHYHDRDGENVSFRIAPTINGLRAEAQF